MTDMSAEERAREIAERHLSKLRGRNSITIDVVTGDIDAAITAAVAAERAACEEIARTYEDWCGNWGEIGNEIAARECAKEIADAIKAHGLAPQDEEG